MLRRWAVKTKPSYPNLVDEYTPTDPALWEVVLDVASGDRLEYTRGDRTIHSPNEGRGYRNMPHNPKGIAWAVKQYNGFGSNWKQARWGVRLHRMACGSVEVTEGPDTVEGARMASEGLLRLSSEVNGKSYWDLTPKGFRVVLAQLTNDLEQKMTQLLRNFDPSQGQSLGSWIESVFRVKSPQTPKGTKLLKEKMQKLVWVLKYRPDPLEIQTDWEEIKPQLPLLAKFTDEGANVVDDSI